MKVVDASVVVDVLELKLDMQRLGDEELAAPHLLDSEVLNALRGRVLGGGLAEPQADDALRAFDDLIISRYPTAPMRHRIWQLRHNLTAYDATYAALAESLGATSLLTRDEALSTAPGLRCEVEVV